MKNVADEIVNIIPEMKIKLQTSIYFQVAPRLSRMCEEGYKEVAHDEFEKGKFGNS